MGTGRGLAARCCVLGMLASALLLGGCGGTEDHPNLPRPSVPLEVTAVINDGRLSVEPNSVGFAGGGSQAPLKQNEGQKAPRVESDEPITVSFTVANTTDTDTALTIRGDLERRSPPILGGGTGDFKVDLPTGDYTVSAEGVSGAETTFKVGPARFSSQNDLLLP